jgi:hypothetical protein
MSTAKWIAAGIGIAAAAGGAAVFAQSRNTEEPAYDVLVTDDAFELREYAPMIVAEVTHTGERQRASGASFRRLAAYIFAQDRPAGGEGIAMTSPVYEAPMNQTRTNNARTNGKRVDQNERIAMTSPVLHEATDTDEWRMRFVMPANYTLETLPAPPSDITLTEVGARRIAAVRFSGMARNADLIVMESRLTEWLETQALQPVGTFEYAFYNAPMVPGPLRRNEVLIEVKAD